MKAIKFNLLAVAILAVSFAACNNNDEVQSAPDTTQPAELKIQASMKDMSVSTRAAHNLQSTSLTYTNLGIYVWKSGQTAAAGGYTGYSNIAVTEGADIDGSTEKSLTHSSLYFPTDHSDVDVYLYSPRVESPTLAEGTMKMTFTVQDDQSTDDNYVQSDFIYGKATATHDNPTAHVTMYHALSKVLLKVVPSAGLTSTGLTEIKLTGVQKQATINMPKAASAAAPWLTWSLAGAEDASTKNVNTSATASTGDVIVSNSTNDTSIETNAVNNGVAAIIPPQESTDMKVSVTIGEITKTASLNALTTFDAGKAYTIKLKVSGAGLTVQLVEIKDWISAGEPTESNLVF